ncbi:MULTISPECIES: TetR/AcrR family transcriptional regulator [unclassified Rhodococcus (in: high G+C Gram-positive bacteria)]|uniref:TetR/AcrR family transcriptional regulator n=1 Tax=unclassified Rhodococcus (in: high G+C Gram-positive bacteria) TaxID=192944 RepID=UPI00163A9DBE|nr:MULTISPECIES: TetR/AcrR family transcriptional regulator [unclassified Rhodococcus (in: high G+C Gram-positive bacteria)]MBC2641913.1 TetR/AcrR family transcriptional regulator [Rhodococcus sp. 3A]MBC2893346.1 TetR/AcrR family transcriptional regulator [Rhodococcus sp. 4CII]
MADKKVIIDPHESVETDNARGGRPRNPNLDDAIIEATRRRLVIDGYSRMTLGDIASDAGVTRPTLYRRWPGKFELVVDALDFGFRAQRATYPDLELGKLRPFEAFTEAIRRVDPSYFNPDAMILMGNFMGEALRTPELLEIVREHAVEPRVNLVEGVLTDLRSRGEVRDDIDPHTVATMCFGSYYAAFLRGDSDREDLAEKVAATLWPGIAVSQT